MVVNFTFMKRTKVPQYKKYTMKLKTRDMRTDSILEFEGLKFKNTEFNFRNNKEMNKFFDKVLIDSPLRFANLTDQMIVENMHIAFSKKMVTKIGSFVLLSIALIAIFIGASVLIGSAIVGLSVISFILNKRFEKTLNNLNFSRGMFEAMAESDVLEEVRQDLINNKK